MGLANTPVFKKYFPQNHQPSQRIQGFDGIRTIAVLLVVLNHNFYFKFHAGTGGAGVKLFFVLSGFLIISILARRRTAIEAGQTTVRIEVVHFFENRVFRIWPVYFAALLLGVLTVEARKSQPIDPASWIGNVLFLGNLLVANVWFDWRQVGVFWSVGVEEQFYLWAGLALLLCAARRHIAVCCVALCVAVTAALVTMVVVSDPKLARFSIDVGSLTNFGLIAMGGLASLALPESRFVKHAAAPSLAVYLYFTFAGWPEWMSGAIGFFLPGILAMLVLAGIRQNQDSLLVKMLEIAPVAYLGRISYGIYLFHTLVHFDILPVQTWFDDHATYKALAETSLSFALAAASWHYFEKPILDFRDRRRARQAAKRDEAMPVGQAA